MSTTQDSVDRLEEIQDDIESLAREAYDIVNRESSSEGSRARAYWLPHIISTKDIVDELGEVLVKAKHHMKFVSLEAENAVMVERKEDGEQFILEDGEWEVDRYHVVAKDYTGKIVDITYLGYITKALQGDPERMEYFMSELLNTYGNMEKFGLETGKECANRTHRSTYRTMVIWAISFLKGLAETNFVDDRNQGAHEIACQIKAEDYEFGRYI